MMSRSTTTARPQRQARLPRIGARARTSIVGALAAFGAIVWAGCGSPDDNNRYYCDAVGCYECDAYGCSDVSPPAKSACTGAKSCPPGSVCTASGCTTTCSDAVPCSKGEVCKAGLCAAPATEPGAKKDCTSKSDCEGGKVCVAGTCEACGGLAGPCPCASKSDCASGQACVAGSCTSPANLCKFSSECEAGKICAEGQCLASCEAAPCATGFACDKGVCKPSGGTSTCTTDQQCGGATPQCVGGSCVKACVTDPECGAGSFCDQGACVVDTRPKPNCTEDSQCGGSSAPRKCLDGFCRYTCSSAQGDMYCRTIDNRIGFCAPDLVCRSEAEAKAQCTDSSTCAGKACIDNACK